MYLNTKIIESKGLTPFEVNTIQLCKQMKFEDISEYIEKHSHEDVVARLIEEGYIEQIKGTPKQTFFQKLRTTKKGSDLIEDISTPEISVGDSQMRDYLIDMYLSHEDSERVVGNKKKIAIYISILRNHLELSLHEFFYLCEFFLSNHSYTKCLEYIFFNSNKNRYGKFKDNLEDSPLYQFYDTRKVEVENYWSRKIKQ